MGQVPQKDSKEQFILNTRNALKFLHFVGTFMAVDVLTRQLTDKGTVSVEASVRKIRRQRAQSVETVDQYLFVHSVLIKYAVAHSLLDVDPAELQSVLSEVS